MLFCVHDLQTANMHSRRWKTESDSRCKILLAQLQAKNEKVVPFSALLCALAANQGLALPKIENWLGLTLQHTSGTTSSKKQNDCAILCSFARIDDGKLNRNQYAFKSLPEDWNMQPSTITLPKNETKQSRIISKQILAHLQTKKTKPCATLCSFVCISCKTKTCTAEDGSPLKKSHKQGKPHHQTIQGMQKQILILTLHTGCGMFFFVFTGRLFS